jgi:DNA repair exonuclease SbcCD ATPase subunit
MSYENEKFDFDDNGLVLIQGTNKDEGDSNGSGKSSIWDGISWVLFGQTVRGLKNDDVINRRTGKDCYVSLEVVINHTYYHIVRYRKHGEFKNRLLIKLAEGTEVIEKGTIALTEEYLHELIGIDYDLFRCTVMFAQGETFNFVNSGNKKQKEILSKIMKVDLDSHLSTAKRMKKELESEIQENEKKVAVLESHIKENPEDDYKDKVEEWERNRSHKITNRQLALDSLEFDIKNIEIKDTTKIKEISEKLEVKCKEKAQEIYDKYVEKSIKVKVKFDSIKAELDQLDEFIKKGECPTCGQKTEDLGSKRHKLGNDAMKLQLIQHELEEKERSEKFVLEELEEKKKKLAQMMLEEASNLERKENYIKAAETYRNDIKELKESVNPYTELIEQEVEKQKKIQAKLKLLEGVNQRNENKLEYLDFWVNAFGDAGIKSFIFDLVAGSLTEKANKYVDILTNGQVSVRFDTQSQLKSGAIREKFDCSVITDGKKVKYEAYSGGEKRRISLAVDMALSEIMTEYHGEKFNVVVFDEQDNYLDRQGRESYLTLLRELAKERSVYVVSHDAEFKSKFDNTWNIVKERGVSRLQ